MTMGMKKNMIIMKLMISQHTVLIVLRLGGNFVPWNSFVGVPMYLRHSGEKTGVSYL